MPVLSEAILIIGAHEKFVHSLTLAFHAEGQWIISARYEASAWLLAQSLKPRAILCELRLEEGSGFALARRVRASPWGGGVKLIALTQTIDRATSEVARLAGFDACFLKSSFDYIYLDPHPPVA